MMKRMLPLLAGVAFLTGIGTASAAEVSPVAQGAKHGPMRLTDAQMDGVTAGFAIAQGLATVVSFGPNLATSTSQTTLTAITKPNGFSIAISQSYGVAASD